MINNTQKNASLKREITLLGAVMMGLGSIIGTGVFVSIGIAAGITGPSVILAILIAAVVALCNALSSAQLAANHAVSGGTYEYGYHYLNPALGFTAGWMFLCAKIASASTAALGFSGYLLNSITSSPHPMLMIVIASITVLILTGLVLMGIRRSNTINIGIVSITILSLLIFIIAGIPTLFEMKSANLFPFFVANQDKGGPLNTLLHATALMFVAYTGYGRIATLGEEVKDPHKTIPLAIKWTLIISAALYIGVGLVAVLSVGSGHLAAATNGNAAPLETVARMFEWSHAHWVVAIGAMTSMLGVLLNLILGLSRTVLAMGRRKDMPAIVTQLNAAQTTPTVAVILVGLAITGFTLTGNIKLVWSFSAFSVLIYYSITNLAALRLPKDKRLYSPIFAWGGLASCLFLAFWIDRSIWMTGLLLIGLGLCWHIAIQKIARKKIDTVP